MNKTLQTSPYKKTVQKTDPVFGNRRDRSKCHPMSSIELREDITESRSKTEQAFKNIRRCTEVDERPNKRGAKLLGETIVKPYA